MTRVYNFSPGPATLPEPVLKQAQEELLDWQNHGISILELSHRSLDFMEVADKSREDLSKLMNIPDNYEILFMQGGARSQFSAIPMNLLGDKKSADYIHTGIWSWEAIKEARTYCDVNIVASNEASNFTNIPDSSTWYRDPKAAYFHYCPNETIDGVEFHWTPQVEIPLVADMSSMILSKPIDVNEFGLIYACAQKNCGPAGITIVIVRKDLIQKPYPGTPGIFQYKNQIATKSLYNTAPTFNWYMVGLVFEWIFDQGGVEALGKINQKKANLLYEAIDASDFYFNKVEKGFRSRMNVPFYLSDETLNDEFLKEAKTAGLVGLKGHKRVGGMRASIYNAMPLEGVTSLLEFMKEFEKKH